MKNLKTLFFVFLIISSCQKLETNSPAFQASVDDIFFKADLAEANYFENDDYFVLQGKSSDEIITLRGANLVEGANIDFGEDSENFAIYQNASGTIYSTTIPGGTIFLARCITRQCLIVCCLCPTDGHQSLWGSVLAFHPTVQTGIY